MGFTIRYRRWNGHYHRHKHIIRRTAKNYNNRPERTKCWTSTVMSFEDRGSPWLTSTLPPIFWLAASYVWVGAKHFLCSKNIYVKASKVPNYLKLQLDRYDLAPAQSTLACTSSYVGQPTTSSLRLTPPQLKSTTEETLEGMMQSNIRFSRIEDCFFIP